MGHFVITFNLKWGDDYSARYKSFTDRVKQLAKSSWDETTSFYAIEANGTAESICDELYIYTRFDSSTDAMVVIDLDNRKKAVKGQVSETALLTRCLGF